MPTKKNDYDPDDCASSRKTAPSLDSLLGQRLSRRDWLTGAVSLASGAMISPVFSSNPALGSEAQSSSLDFVELAHGDADQLGINVASGYRADVLISWGDPVLKGGRSFDAWAVNAERQLLQFGYNNDFIAFMPIDGPGGVNSQHGLLCVNHEYSDRSLMTNQALTDADLMRLELAAHGHSVIEVKKTNGQWHYLADGAYNRRITAAQTDFEISGPAAGHDRLKTKADPTGRLVRGTLNNCAGGKTPWGTVLMAEENFNLYFAKADNDGPEQKSLARYGVGHKSRYPHWGRVDPRFDPAREPHEANRFGWMVEFDPYDPASVPVKRTALGRFKHEGADVVINGDGRVVVYSGDDQAFEYIYRFVSDKPFDPEHPENNRDILDHGTLSVARFDADGRLNWLPLVFGQGPLTDKAGFRSQADILIDARLAADSLGATPMDRPEEVAANPVSGDVFAVLTKNKKRSKDDVNPANPRPNNQGGHILKLMPPKSTDGSPDHAAKDFGWDVFILAGKPEPDGSITRYHRGISKNGWFAAPDNIAFDPKGRVWIATDGAPKMGIADGLWAADAEGPGTALTRHFFNTPAGAELCGPEFTPDGKSLFVAVQHPGQGSEYDLPSTRWPAPDDSDQPPRPSIVVISHEKGQPIG